MVSFEGTTTPRCPPESPRRGLCLMLYSSDHMNAETPDDAGENTLSERRPDRVHPAVRVSYGPRILGHILFSLVTASTFERGQALAAAIVVGTGILWPHLAHLIGTRRRNRSGFPWILFYADTLLCGIYIGVMSFSPLPSVAVLGIIIGVNLMMGGFRLLVRSTPFLVVPLILFAAARPLDPSDPGYLTVSVSVVALAIFFLVTSWSIHETTRNLIDTRRDLRQKNVRIVEQARELEIAFEEISSISEVGRTVNATLDLDRVVNAVMQELQKMFPFDQMAILFVDEEDECLVLERQFGTGFTPELVDRLRGLKIALGSTDSVFARVVRERRSIVLSRIDPQIVDKITATDQQVYHLNPAASALLSPLEIEGKVIGVVSFGHTTETFDLHEREVEMIERYVTHVATAIRNARLMEQSRDARAAAEEANETKSRFLANMSHELRTPMNAIIGYSEMLQEDAEDQGLDGFVGDLQKIRSAGKHLLELINGVLDLSKIEAGKMDLYLEEVAVRSVIDDVVATVDSIVRKNGNTLELDLPQDPGMMYTDVTKIRQSLINLIGNAAKFTENGSIWLSVRRETRDGRDWLQLAVSDSGIGMTEEQVSRLFQPFMQADASTTRKYGGSGLGLAITHRFCRMLGGRIEVESEPGTGTTFTIDLPAEVVQKTVGKRPDTMLLTSSGTLRLPKVGAPTVLVVDDDESVHDLMRHALNKAGYNVEVASTGDEALALALELRPDAITLDAIMPGTDGWTVLGRLKSHPELSKIPVIMMTMVDDRSRGFALGAAEYLTKPVEQEQVARLLRKYTSVPSEANILLIDDDDGERLRTGRFCRDQGWNVWEAEGGRPALGMIAENAPDLILLDLMMPEMDGFQFLEELRARHEWCSIPVIVLTAKDLDEADRDRLSGSVTRILQKGTTTRDQLIGELRQKLATQMGS